MKVIFEWARCLQSGKILVARSRPFHLAVPQKGDIVDFPTTGKRVINVVTFDVRGRRYLPYKGEVIVHIHPVEPQNYTDEEYLGVVQWENSRHWDWRLDKE